MTQFSFLLTVTLYCHPVTPLLPDKTVDHQALLKQFEYLNHMNPHTFEVEDLDRLIKSVYSLNSKHQNAA